MEALVIVVSLAAFFGFMSWLVIRERPDYPAVEPGDILFREDFGHAMFLSRSPIQVTVTRNEVWTKTWIPEPTFGIHSGLDHRILRSQIVECHEGRKTLGNRPVVVRWRDEKGPHRLDLVVGNPDAMLAALEKMQEGPASK